MSDYSDSYGHVLRYAADSSDIAQMVKQMEPRDWRGGDRADHLKRQILADMLEDEGRHHEAGLLRKPDEPLYRDENGIHNSSDIQFNPAYLSDAERQYLATALWSSMDESDENTGGYPMNANYSIQDIDPATAADMIADWRHFRHENADDIGDEDSDAAHYFWLTRNGHGANFRDGPRVFGEDQTDNLYHAATKYPEYNLYVGDDGLIHGSGG